MDKCFTYVPKTIANLTTYSRKWGDYNGIIIFEIDIMKNSYPLNLKFTFFCHCENQNNTSFMLKTKQQKICEKVMFDKDLN